MRALGRRSTRGPYDPRVLSPTLIAAILIVGVISLPPARRLFDAGRSTSTVATWFFALWVLGVLVVLAPVSARFAVPVLVVLYVLPFVNWRRGIARLFGRPSPEVRPPPRNVTPPGADEPRRAR
jgi:hypothetical protein